MVKLCDFVEVEDLNDETKFTLLRVVLSFQMTHVMHGRAELCFDSTLLLAFWCGCV